MSKLDLTLNQIIDVVKYLSPVEKEIIIRSIDFNLPTYLEKVNDDSLDFVVQEAVKASTIGSEKLILDLDLAKVSLVEINNSEQDSDSSSHNLENLYPSQESYEYITRQKKIFEDCLPELIHQYAGKHILFEDGLVIDADEDEDTLLDRVWETDFVNQRMGINGHGIYCHLVPMNLR